PQPQDSNPPKTTPTTALGLDRYPANPPGHHRPSPPVDATSHRHLQHPWPSPPITARHYHSHCHSWHPPAITAVTATSAPGLGYHTTLAPAPPITPGLRRDPQRIMIAHHYHRPPHATPRSRSLLTTPPPWVSALPVQDLRATRHVLTSPHAAPRSHPKPRHRDPLLKPRPESQAIHTA
ncbi:hypothetical protein C0993_009013, partial [Termitomyces sp. T159_Od127]